MKKILAIALMMAVLVCPVLAAEAAGQDSGVPYFELQVVTEATCLEKGVSAYVNRDTGEVLFYFETPTIAHTPSGVATSCDDEIVCTVCGTVLQPATDHVWEYQYDAVQNDDGSFEDYGTWKCAVCGAIQEASLANAEFFYGEEAEEAPAAEPADASGEPSAEPAEASGEPSAEPAEAGDASGEPAAEEVEEEPAAEEEAPAEEPAAEDEAAAEEEAPAEEPAEEEAPAGEAEAGNPNYVPDAHNWGSIEVVLALVIIAVGALLMLSFGKKKKKD